MDDQAFESVAGIIAAHFMVPVGMITPETTALDIDGWDSVSHTMLILELEERLGVLVPLDKAHQLKNVGDLAKVVKSLKS